MFKLIDEGSVTLETLESLLEDKLSLALWTWDLKTKDMKWSKGVYRLFGFQPGAGAPSYSAMEQAVYVEDRKPQSEIEQALHEAVTVERELRAVMPDGRVRWIKTQVSPIVEDHGAPTKAIGISADITHQRDTLHFLKLTASRFVALCKTSPALFWTITPDGGRAEILNSPTPGWYQNTDFRTLIHPSDVARFDEQIAVSLPLRQPFRMALDLRIEDGSYRRHWLRAMPIVNDKGELQEWLGLARDPIDARQRWMSLAKSRSITGTQMRAGRAILRWSVADLAVAANVSPAVIRRLEDTDDASTPEAAHESIERALKQAGVEFTDDLGVKPGVRPR
jgi:PAS domain S-box-containing protein